MSNHIAPEGQIYVCGACGKTSRTRYGFFSDGTARGADFMPDGSRVSERGWDESCMMHAVLCYAGGLPWRAVPQ
jgi:hypothetical protein